MDVRQIPKQHLFSESSHTLLTSQQKFSAFQLDIPSGTNSRPTRTGHNNATTMMEKGNHPQPPQLLWSLPQKRSNQSLTSGRVVDSDESNPRAFSGIYPAKRFKGPITPPLPSPPSSCNKVVTTRLSRPLLDFSEEKIVSLEGAVPAEATADQLDSDRSKTLRSPFEYTKELVASQVDSAAENDIQRSDSNRSGYIYYAPMNASDNTNQILDAHRRVPRRQLYYGDPLSKPESRSLHKKTGSWELRREAERYAEDYKLDTWLDTTLESSAARPCHSEPTRSKHRLWLDLTEQKDKIQEAVSMLKLQET